MEKINTALEVIKTKDLVYPTPMLVDQISYLYNMTNDADQVPGHDTYERYEELKNQFEGIAAKFSE